MIKYIVKFLLVILMLTPVGLGFNYGYGQEITNDTDTKKITEKDLKVFDELAERLIQDSKQEFEDIYNLLDSELSETQKQRTLEIYKEARSLIDSGEIQDPAVLDPKYNTAFEGEISTRIQVKGGEIGVAWTGGKPIIIVSLEKFRSRTVIKPETLNEELSSYKRFIYYMHIYAGDHGYGIWDNIVSKVGDGRRKRIANGLKKFYNKNFVRGADLNIMTVDSQGKLVKSQLSKRPGWLSFRRIKETVGAIFKGRKATLGKLLGGIGMAIVPSAVAYGFVDAQMAAVIAGFTILTQTYYEAYLSYKFTNSVLMQMFKLGVVTMATNLAYLGLVHGGVEMWEHVGHALRNAALGVFVFHTARLNKQLLILAKKTTSDMNLLPEIEMPKKIAGKTIRIFNKEYTIPDKIVTSIGKAKVHDTLTDLVPGVARQTQLAWEVHPIMMIGVAALEHAYTYGIYKYYNLKELKNPAIERIMNEVFYKKSFKKFYSSLVGGCNRLFKKVNPRTPLKP